MSLGSMVWKFNLCYAFDIVLWYLIWCVTWDRSPSIVLELRVGGDDSEFCL